MTAFKGILKRYGDGAEIYSDAGEKTEAHIFIQPIIGNKTVGYWENITDLGRIDTTRYRCFSDEEMKKDGYIICDGVAYDVLVSESFRVGGGVSHWEAVLMKRASEY